MEPCAELRRLGEAETAAIDSSPGDVTWLDDKLPKLKKLRALDQQYNLILLSAVWMHLPSSQHKDAMRILGNLLAPGGLLVVSLRKGPDENHRFHPVNDDKAATYKLGLLRALIRIAESMPGMVIDRSYNFVTIPFGLVGLFWLKLYMPLVLKHNLIQNPQADHELQKGYGWAKENFYSLKGISPFDLRVGSTFGPHFSPFIKGAIRDACRNIKTMPGNYITSPGD